MFFDDFEDGYRDVVETGYYDHDRYWDDHDYAMGTETGLSDEWDEEEEDEYGQRVSDEDDDDDYDEEDDDEEDDDEW